ncbi:RNA polymerase II mediator complex component SRB4 [Colletotrichum higginsianum]|nr:RNA polymerase II mediator complex component SRB4 [Colletotrichum higginsianum]
MSFIPSPSSEPSDPALAEWTKSVRGTAIRDIDTETREVRFDILGNGPQGRPTLQIGAAWRAGDKPLIKRWAWPAVGEDAGKSATQPHIGDIVAAVVQSKEI